MMGRKEVEALAEDALSGLQAKLRPVVASHGKAVIIAVIEYDTGFATRMLSLDLSPHELVGLLEVTKLEVAAGRAYNKAQMSLGAAGH